MKDTYVVVPVFNEEKVIKSVIDNLSKTFENIICVNDGSSDASSAQILKTKACLIEHPINLGQGAALQTGISYALKNRSCKNIVTFDSDGQHRVKDAKKLVDSLNKNDVDIILGSRFIDKSTNLPLKKSLLLKLARLITNMIYGVNLTDTHNGLRVMNRKYAESLDIKLHRMGHASEFLENINKGNFSYKEEPVTIKYTDYSKSKGQPISNMVNIFFEMIFEGKTK